MDKLSVASFSATNDTAYQVQGTLDFVTLPQLLRDSLTVFDKGSEVNIDMGGVTQSNSAALGLMLEWMRQARKHSCDISFSRIPENILAIAQVSDLHELLPQRD